MTQTKKFSQFQGPNPIQAGDIVVGLRRDIDGVLDNWQFTGVGGGGGGGGGITIIITQDTSQLLPGRWVRINSMGLYVHALADTPENAEIVGSVLNILSATQFTLQVVGYVPHGTTGFSGFTPGGVYFLSDTIPGGITLIEPTTNGEVSLPCFIAESADSGWIRQSRGVIIAGTGPIPPGGGGGDDNTEHTVNQPGHPFQVGDWVRVVSNTIYDFADGTSLENSQAIGVVKSVAGPLFTVQQSGYSTNVVTQDDTGNPLVSSEVYYLSATVPGQITSTPPSVYGQATRPVFISESSTDDSGWIFPQRPLTVTGDDPNIIFITQIGHGFIRGDVVRISAANTYVKAQADTFTNSLAVGFVAYVPDTDHFVLQTAGYCAQFFAPFTPLAPSAQYYLSATTPGAITTVEPGTPFYSKPMLAALNPTTGYILEQRPLTTTGGGGGGFIQTKVFYITNTLVTSSALSSNGASIAQGMEFFSTQFTPTNANNLIIIDFCWNGFCLYAFFRGDNSANVGQINAASVTPGSLNTGNFSRRCFVANTTSTFTISGRFGSFGLGAATFNPTNTYAQFTGLSSVIIYEAAPG